MRWKEVIAEWQTNAPIKQIADLTAENDAEMDPNRKSDPTLDENKESLQDEDSEEQVNVSEND